MENEAEYQEKNIDPSCFGVGTKHGCLEILDDGQEYIQIAKTNILNIENERAVFVDMINNDMLEHKDWWGSKGVIQAYVYEPHSFFVSNQTSIRVEDFDNAISHWMNRKTIKHYKCKCRKCGKILYYTNDTIQTNPPYCYRPVYCSNRFSYSNRARNANYKKKEKYKYDESVCLVDDKKDVMPSEKYCDKWNVKREKELREQEEERKKIIASLQRVYSENYDKDLVGMRYESLEILECINDALEIPPQLGPIRRHNADYGKVIVYKEYRCRCYLCGKEHIITCDKFGIYPPTDYGLRAYDGYWRKVSCDCHNISSFQWMVNKLLLENNIPYWVEYSYPDLLGAFGINKLRFDFAVLNDDETVKCLIECQGKQHYEPVQMFGGEYGYNVQTENDELKREYVKQHGIRLIEIPYKKQGFSKIKKILEENSIIARR